VDLDEGPAPSAPQVMSSNRVCALVLMAVAPILKASELAVHDPVRLPVTTAPFTSSSFGSLSAWPREFRESRAIRTSSPPVARRQQGEGHGRRY
jgi:hypothetical protein